LVNQIRAMSEPNTPWPGTPDFYREKARLLLREAEAASTDESRAALLNLAEHWQRLAQTAEHPSW
jgi:hypothetical protein